jgi:broad specificity phosphatase PhoE
VSSTAPRSTTTVLLVRHGESEWNRGGRWQGHADPPLSELGRRQAHELADRLADVPLDAIYASDLERARATAEIVAAAKGMSFVARPALREIDVGEWSGLTTAEIRQRFPEGFRRHADGGDGWLAGEAHAAMSSRIVRAVAGIAAEHPGASVLCVLHGGVIRALLAHAEGADLREYRRQNRGPANGTVARIAVEGGTFSRID